MSAKERALKDLKELKDLDTINQNHSIGSVYRAFPDWLNYAKAIYNSTRDKISKEKERAAEAEEKADAAVRLAQENLDKVRVLETKIDELESQVTKLQEAGQVAEEYLNSKMLEISKVEDIQADLKERGLTEENLSSVLRSNVHGEEELMERISTKQQHRELTEEVGLLQSQRDSLRVEILNDESELAKIKEELLSETNMFDEMKSKHSLWNLAIKLIVTTLQLGFTVEILEQLVRELHKLSIIGEPKRSARRALSRMNKIVEEIELDDAISRKTAQLEALEKKYSILVATIETLAKKGLENLREVENAAVIKISSVSKSAQNEVSNVTGHIKASIKSVEETSLDSILNVKQAADAGIKKLESRVSTVFINNDIALRLALDNYKSEVEAWGNIREQAGRYSEHIKLTTVFLGVQLDETGLLNVDPFLVARLVERIHFFIVRKWPDAKTTSPDSVSRRENAINSMWEAKLSSVSSWLAEAVAHQARRQPR